MKRSILPVNKMILADVTLLIVAVIWGGGFIAAKEALTTMTPFAILSTRFLLSAGLLFCFFRHRICQSGRLELKFGLIIGIIQFIAFLFQLEGLKTTTVEKQSFLVTAYVIFVPFLSWLATRKAIRIRDLICAFLALCGLALLCLHSETLTPAAGDMLSVAFAVCFAIQIVYVGNFVKNTDIAGMTFFQLLTTGLMSLPFLDISALYHIEEIAAWGIAYLVILNTAFAFLAQNIAQQYTSDAHASLIISLESVFGFFLAVWFYHNPITLQELIGCVFMLAALVLSNCNRSAG